jgi:cytochrome b
MLELIEITWSLITNMHLWLILTALVAAMAAKEGVMEITIGFVGLFFLILMLGWDELLGEYVMVNALIAIGLGLMVAFFIWLAKE